jgi:hypothetical protein
MDERAFYQESQATRPAALNCPYCRTTETYDLRWVIRKKKDRLPPNADERDRAKFQKAQSYMVLVEDKVACKNMRCRRRFDVSGAFQCGPRPGGVHALAASTFSGSMSSS